MTSPALAIDLSSKDGSNKTTKNCAAAMVRDAEGQKGRKPRFDFANLARAVMEEKENRDGEGHSEDAMVISHVMSQFGHVR
nr:hypothetical protein BaRGS_006809 [Batillaria attramentaria]